MAFIEDASSAGISAGVVDAEGHHFHDAGPGNDVLADSSAETWVANHRAEPVLDLSCQVDEARYILLTGESDDHLSSLAVVRQ